MLHLHRSERADALVGALAHVLADPPDDAFTPDVVAVPTRGVERWLAQRLSHHLGAASSPVEGGVCANVSFGSPARLVASAVAAAVDLAPDDDPWRSSALTWPLLQVVDECAGEPWCAVLGRHLGVGADDELRQGRRLGVVRHLARLFSAYAAQRPAMVRAWAEGRDDDGTVVDGAAQPLPSDLAWQARLWRALRERLGVPGPAERLPVAVQRLVDEPALLDLPPRLSVFGATRLAADQLAVLHALSAHRDVHLWLVHPSPVLWQEVAELAPVSPHRRALASPAQHPLLASMARDVTELQLRLAALGPASDTHHPAVRPPATLLGAVQRRLRDDDTSPPAQPLAPDDRSVQVHACHGRARQVEVLREVLVGLFADDPTLEPRDVVVMCPDVEAFAPLLAATFGLAGDGADAPLLDDARRGLHPGQQLRVRLADRSLRLTNPVLELLSRLLDLADSRVTASQLLDLAASEPVRRRFRFDDDELDRVREWSVAAGVHWGEDVARRARFGLGQLRQGTWDTALDRLLLGVAMADEDARFVGSALPLDDVDSTDIDVAGRLAELVDRLSAVLHGLDRRAPVEQWLDQLDLAVDQLADAAPSQVWQLGQARQVLADVRQAAAGAADGAGAALRLPDVRALLADRLAGRPTRAGFRTGALTVCSLEPMRAVPHRVVCLLGLDDSAFPRAAGSDGDDVLLRDPCVGERDRRSEDRQLFLDAVASAGEHLVVVYSGADERTGAIRPPAVPVSELLDAVEQAVDADHTAVRRQVLVRHPLQVVDERNFTPGALQRPGPFSWDRRSYGAALAGRGERASGVEGGVVGGVQGGALVSRPLPKQPRTSQIDLDDLVEALEHPARWFLRRRLGVSVAGEVDDVDDRVPLELGPLDAWQVGDRLLAACLAGVDRDRAVAAEWRRGDVPPKELGRAALTELVDKVTPLAAAALTWVQEPATAVDVWAELPSGLAVTGTVSGVHGDVLVRTVFSRLGAKHRLRAWVQLLALVVSRPDRPWRAVTIGRPQGSRPGVLVAEVTAPNPAVAEQRLEELVRLRERAERTPLPVPVDTAFAYASSRYGGNEVVQASEAAAKQWSDELRFADEYRDLCWGLGCGFDDLAGVPEPDEQRWWPQDPTRLGVLARRVWQPLLDHETTGLR